MVPIQTELHKWVINEGCESFVTAIVLRKSSVNFQWDVRSVACVGPYVSAAAEQYECRKDAAWKSFSFRILSLIILN
jgi:hypothetical protein